MALNLFKDSCGQGIKEFISSFELSGSREAFISTTITAEGIHSGWLVFSQDKMIDEDCDTKFLLNNKGQIRTFKTVDAAVNALRGIEEIKVLTAI